MSTLEHPRPEGLLHNPGFSQVVVAAGTRMIHTAGQVSIDERTEQSLAKREHPSSRTGRHRQARLSVSPHSHCRSGSSRSRPSP